ncbi:MAG: bifunctional phosphopantothenoylcysteine decarboxylase/phosphopantothenate--cysteine ligase CoaBC [Dehalococcoidia bacterium]|nr:bifunctional phosphopantothenoylcysteine decarboxylase/phosphopantothenate--cysteine ligase CoaBC [Dehalococcoidia bacterium]
MLAAQRIVLGVTGSVACYKAVDLASKLTQAGAVVDVILTRAAQEFVRPLAFRGITHQPVVTDLFDSGSELAVEHVALAERANIVIVAPATANVIARMANGLADDALTCTILATRAPVVVAPAMDAYMYDNPATQENIKRLRERGVTIVGPAHGHLASGLTGIGRMAPVEEIMGVASMVQGRAKGDLAGRRIVVTAGGTQEPIDPVRFVGNRSSGKMGFAIAEAARDRGARVTLITAPTYLPDPPGIETMRVQSAREMQAAVQKAMADADALTMAAAVADYRPTRTASQKIKKTQDTLTVDLVKNPDILAEIRGDFVRVGFAAESQDVIANAQAKLRSKGLDIIVANDVSARDSGFSVDTNRVTLLDKSGQTEHLPLLLKIEVAHRILDRVAQLLRERGKKPART